MWYLGIYYRFLFRTVTPFVVYYNRSFLELNYLPSRYRSKIILFINININIPPRSSERFFFCIFFFFFFRKKLNTAKQ